jgi:hypothetical protein
MSDQETGTVRLVRGIVGGLAGAFLMLCLSSCALRLFAPELFDNYPPPPLDLNRSQDLLGIALAVGAVAIGVLVGVRSAKPEADPHRGPHCRRCGYDLTGNVSGACPECGTPVPDHASAPPGHGVH